jgi:beta-lactam-binding protein with PASTA domain
MVTAVLAVLTLGVIQIYNQVTSSAAAPELIGLSGEEAQALVRRAGLNWQQMEVNHDTIPADTVISQIPEPETSMTKGDSVVVTISLGPVAALVPDLTRFTVEDAGARLRERGFGMLVFRSASTEPVDTVIAQNPGPGEPAPTGTEVEVTVSGGSTIVPDIYGKSLAEATALLAENELAVGKVEYQEVQDPAMANRVMTQMPTAGTMATLQAQVTLTLAQIGKAFHSEVSITIPPAEEGRSLRVVLVENGQEVEQYSTALPATSSQTPPFLVPLSSDIRGPMVCRIYVNDVLFDEQEVELQ